jgi:5,10-methylenetetrahydromethanopterin reductase
MKISFGLLPDHPLNEILDTIEVADRLGFHGVYGADETFHKDCFQIFAAAAHRTRSIILAPDVTHVILRDPTMVVQAMATLDELTGGRTELNYSIGNFAMLEQYGLQDAAKRSLSRMREAYGIMRSFLDEGVLDHVGEFYTCTGMFTSARPVQNRMPIKIGAMRGPKSFEFAGEVTDGMHQALGYSREANQYAADHVRIGAERAGRDWKTLDIAAWGVSCVAEDRAAARECVRVLVAFYIPAMPVEQVMRHGIAVEQTQPIHEAFAHGDVERAIELTTPDLVEKLSFSGTPEDVVAQIRENVVPAGMNHVILSLCDPTLAEHWLGRPGSYGGVPHMKDQLQLIHDRVMPALASY